MSTRFTEYANHARQCRFHRDHGMDLRRFGEEAREFVVTEKRVRGADYDMVVCDEAHRLRNHLTLGWKFLNDLNPRYLLLLTATPVQNDLRELYNLVTLVRPGTVGTFSQFRRDFLSGHDRRSPRNTPRLRALLESVRRRVE